MHTQDMLNDVKGSVLVGRPFFRGTFEGCTTEQWRKVRGSSTMYMNSKSAVQQYDAAVAVQYCDAHAAEALTAYQSIQYAMFG